MRKKKTKAEAKAARRAKLDPDSAKNRSAREVMDERAGNKRKARDMEEEVEDEEEDEDDDDSEMIEGIEPEKPGEGLKKKTAGPNKKQKRDTDDEDDDLEDDEAATAKEAPQPQEKLSKKAAKLAAKAEKKKAKKAEKKAKQDDAPKRPGEDVAEPTPNEISKPPSKAEKKKARKEEAKKEETASKAPEAESEEEAVNDEADVDEEHDDAEQAALDFSGLQQDEDDSSRDSPHSPTFDAATSKDTSNGEAASTSTSISSTVAPSEKPKHIKLPSDTSHIRARLEAKIAELRQKRKADGPDGKPIRTRQELIESRRHKEAQRKAKKKEVRQLAKLEEERKREEALASNSPSVMSPAVELDERAGNFAFGRVAFGDGSQLSHDLSYVLNQKKKGASDPKTALLKVQAQKQRLNELDAEKRKDIAEKEQWLTARRRVEGEKIRDDEATLKRAIKRKDAQKRKSEKAWKERKQGVATAQKERQKKREDNIRKRREDKMLGKAGKKKKGSATKKKGRPGFEGSLGMGGKKK